MSVSRDPFAERFDSIEIDRSRAPSPAAIESALVACAAHRPGFYLADDAGGRFVVDRDFGVVSLTDEGMLARELGQVHTVRLRVVESSGESYELDMKLRVTGMVPQMVGAEAFDFRFEAAEQESPAYATVAPWSDFAAAYGRQAKSRPTDHGAYGVLIAAPLPATIARVSIDLSDPLPAPAPAHAVWSI